MDVKKELGLTFGEDIPGGGYLAERDGEFWSIRDVPFFSELPAGTRSNEKAISREWMESVVKRHQELENDQKHLPPVHVNHHDAGRENFRVGFLRPTRVGRLVLDGKPKWTLFGDIIRVEDRHFDEIQNVKYPYRSAEIGSGWKPEIGSLALLEDESPHFKLPMLTIGEERRHFDTAFSPSQRPAIAFAEAGDSSYICFSFKGEDMSKHGEKTEPEVNNPEEKKTEKLKDDNDNKLADGIAEVIALLRGLVKDSGSEGQESRPGEKDIEPSMLKESTENESKPDPNGAPELMARVIALEEHKRQSDLAEKAERLVRENAAALRSAGWHLTEETECAMLAFARESEASLTRFCEQYKKTMPKDPPKTLEEAEIFSEDSPDIAKYKTRSPEILENARVLSQQYDELNAAGGKMSTTREEFIDINLESMTA